MEKLRHGFWEPIDREWQVLKEFATLVGNRPKFIPLVAAMYAVSVIDHRHAAVFRAAYAFSRYIDDVVDGDRPVADPLAYVEKYQRIAATGTTNDGTDPIARLLLFSIHALEGMTTRRDDVRGNFVRLINAIAVDRKRAAEKKLLTQQELDQYYQDLFTPALNLSLLCAGSAMRTRDLPEMVTLQGHLYSVRDLPIDWPRGIYNIPVDVILNPPALSEAEGIEDPDPPLETVLQKTQVAAWIRNEKEECRQHLTKLKQRLKTNGDKRARLICALPIRELTKIANSS